MNGDPVGGLLSARVELLLGDVLEPELGHQVAVIGALEEPDRDEPFAEGSTPFATDCEDGADGVVRDVPVELLAARVGERCGPVTDCCRARRAELRMHGDADVEFGEEHGYSPVPRESSRLASLMPRQLGHARDDWLRTWCVSRVRGTRHSLAAPLPRGAPQPRQRCGR